MICTYCGKPIPDGSPACMYCGQSRTAPNDAGGRRKTVVENQAQLPETRGYVPPQPNGAGGLNADGPPPAGGGRGRTVGDDAYVPSAAPAGPVGWRPDAAAPPAGRGRTRIDDEPAASPGRPGPAAAASRPRRVAGWMVSFDFNEAGQEYVIREGRNSLSRGKDADISLFFDDYVSTPHAVIVCHPDGECAIQDQMSSGGTFINGQKVPIGGVSPLRNGDILRCGRSNFKVFLLSQADLADLVPSKRDKAAKR